MPDTLTKLPTAKDLIEQFSDQSGYTKMVLDEADIYEIGREAAAKAVQLLLQENSTFFDLACFHYNEHAIAILKQRILDLMLLKSEIEKA